MRVYDLRTEWRTEPLEIDEPSPTLSWKLATDLHGERPAGFSLALEQLDARQRPIAVVWSAEVPMDQISVKVSPEVLEAFTMYRWTIIGRGVDNEGLATEPSEASARFETGFLESSAWTAQWISRNPHPDLSLGRAITPPAPTPIQRSFRTMYSAPPSQFRHRFEVSGRIARARLYISAHGIYRAFVNANRAGADELTPGWTHYPSRLEYQAYDVTGDIRSGTNVLSVIVADGWWSGYLGYNTRRQADQYGSRTELIAQLRLEFEDGRVETIETGDGWREHPGAITMADLLMGEYHDPARETAGWMDASYCDDDWHDAEKIAGDRGMLQGQIADPVRVLMEVPARTVTATNDGSYLVDFGQNLVGRVRIRLHGRPKGRIVEILHGETLDNGHVYTDNLRTAEARDVFVTTGESEQIFEPVFSLHGFRFAEIRGLNEALRTGDLAAVVLGSDLPVAGDFSTGSDLVTQLHSNIVWSQRGNYVGVPTDCPQRDERLGWTADTQIFARTAAFNSDVHSFLARWLRDLVAGQDAFGRVADVAPIPPTSENFDVGAPGWGDAAVIVPWVLYEEYGDLDLLSRHYPSMRAWVEYVATNNPDGLWTRTLGNNYGDWLSVESETPREVVATAYRIRSTDLVARAAEALGHVDEAKHYRAMAARSRDAFTSTFVSDDGVVQGDTQSGYLFAIAWDLVPATRRPDLTRHLTEGIEARGRRLTSGFLGVSLLCPVLTQIGRPDLATALVLQTDYPSWGYSISQGATTIWERWDGWTEARGFQSIEMNSFNHYSLGSVGEWLYQQVAGIAQAPGSVGYQSLRIAPLLAPELSPVSAWHESVRGRIEVSWHLDGATGCFEVLLPPGVEAEIRLPGIETSIGSGRHRFDFATDMKALSSLGAGTGFSDLQLAN